MKSIFRKFFRVGHFDDRIHSLVLSKQAFFIDFLAEEKAQLVLPFFERTETLFSGSYSKRFSFLEAK